MSTRTTDASGDELSEAIANWLVFIGLHLDADRQWTARDLLSPFLRSIGYRDRQEQERLAQPGESPLIVLTETLQRLCVAELATEGERRRLGVGEPTVFYRVAGDVRDIYYVTDRLGAIWSDVGTDEIDSFAELGWLVIMALRMHGKALPSGDLHDKLDSLLVQNDRGVLDSLLRRLIARGYVEYDKKMGIGRGYKLTDRGWGGVSSLRSQLMKGFGSESLPRRTDHVPPTTSTTHEQAEDAAPPSGKRDSHPMLEVEELAWTLIQALRASGSLSFDRAQGDVLDRLSVPHDAGILARTSGPESQFEHGMRRARLALLHRAKVVRVRRDSESGQDMLVLQPAGETISRDKVRDAVRQNEEFIASGAGHSDPVRTSLPSISDLADEMRLRFHEQGDPQLSVQEINEHLVRVFDLSPEQLDVRHNPSSADGESELEYRARSARNQLRHNREIRSTSAWENGREGPSDTYSHGEGAASERGVADTADTDQWAYDYQTWCWETLEAIRDLSQDAIDEDIPNGTISGALADRLQLSPAARNVRSSRNPSEREYTARCATMRELLKEIGLIERGKEGPTWHLTRDGEADSEAVFATLIENVDLESLSGANGTYRGNSELEEVVARDLSVTRGQGPMVADEDTGPQVARGAGSIVAPDNQELSDVQLCVATLESLPTEEDDYLRQSDLMDAVIDRLGVSGEYRRLPAPPWVKRDKQRTDMTLFEYRMEHVFRALSIGPIGLIRDGGLDFSDAGDRWFLTTRGRHVVQSGNVADQVAHEVAEYFNMHDYANWVSEDWMDEVIEVLRGLGRDGTPFEHLVAKLLAAQDDVEDALVQPQGYLDAMGVDVTATLRQESGPLKVQLGAMRPETGQRAAVLFVQCKRWFSDPLTPDAFSKLFGFGVRLRQQASRGNVRYDVAGGLTAYFGDFTRDATWMFWALRMAWRALDDAEGDSRKPNGEETGARPQPDLRWEIWDGQRIFALMREHQIGVTVKDDGEVVVDVEYLRGLPSRRGSAAKSDET